MFDFHTNPPKTQTSQPTTTGFDDAILSAEELEKSLEKKTQKKSPDQSVKNADSGSGLGTAAEPSAGSGKKLDGLAASRKVGDQLTGVTNESVQKAFEDNQAFARQTRDAQETSLLEQLWNTAKNVGQKGLADLQATRAELYSSNLPIDFYGNTLNNLPSINLDALFGNDEGDIIQTDNGKDATNRLIQSAIENKNAAGRPAIQSTSQLRPLSSTDGWKDLTALVTNAITQAGIQIPQAVLTKGFGSLVQANGDIYLAGVQKLAEKEGKTPQQIIAEGKDDKIVPLIAGSLSALLDNVGAKGVKDAVLTKELKQVLQNKVLKGVASGSKEAVTEAGQTLIENVASDVAGGDSVTEAVSNVKAQDLKDAAVQGFIGGGGLSVAGGVIANPSQDSINEQSEKETLSQTAARFDTDYADIIAKVNEQEQQQREIDNAQKQISDAQDSGDAQTVVKTAEQLANTIEAQVNEQNTDPNAGAGIVEGADPVTQPATKTPATQTPADVSVPEGEGSLGVVSQTPDNSIVPAGEVSQEATPTDNVVSNPVRELSEADKLKNTLIGLTTDYNNLNNRQKSGNEGSRIRQQISQLASNGNLEVKQEQGRITILEDGKPIKRTNVDTPTSPAADFVPFSKREETAKPFIQQGVEAARKNPGLFFGLGLQMNARDIAGAVADFDGNKNTNRLQKLLNTLESGYKDGFFRYSVRQGVDTVTYDIPADEYFSLAAEIDSQVENDPVTETFADVLKNNTFTLDDILAVATSDNPFDPNRFESTFYEDLTPDEFTEFVEILKQAKDEQENFASDTGSDQASPQAGEIAGGNQSEISAQEEGGVSNENLSQVSNPDTNTSTPVASAGDPGTSSPESKQSGQPRTKSKRIPGESQFAKSVIDYDLLKPEQLAKDPVLYQVGTNEENIRQGLALLQEVGEAEVNARLTNYITGNESFKKGELKTYAVAGMLLVKGWDNARLKAIADGNNPLADQLAQQIADLVPQLSLAFTDGGQLVQVASLLDMVRSMDQVIYRLAEADVNKHNSRVSNQLDTVTAQEIAQIIAQAKEEMKAEMEALRQENQTLKKQSAADIKQARKRIAENQKKAKDIVKAMFKDVDNNPCF